MVATTTSNSLRSIRNSHVLPDGRVLSYFTYETTGKEDVTTTQSHVPHPVIYFDGYLHGSGNEGGLYWAEAAARNGCELYLVVRPGFGHSDADPNRSLDGCLDGFARDVLDFVHSRKWKSYSVVGASGGGPFAQVFLKSYLSMHVDQDDDDSACRLEALGIVAGICCPAGVDGMLGGNKIMYGIVSRTTGLFFGWFWRGVVLFVLANLRFAANHPNGYRIGPIKIVHNNTSDEAPRTDTENLKESFRQGLSAASLEARVLFRDKQGYEKELKQIWKHRTTSDELDTKKVLPRVRIFHGVLDVDVPVSHARYVHNEIFGGAGSVLTEYEDLDHRGLGQKLDNVMQSLAPDSSAKGQTKLRS